MAHNTSTPPGGTFPLGDRAVARIGYGAMQLRGATADPDKAVALLRRARDLGADHIDTAHFYGNGFVNALIRTAYGTDAGIFVATKVGADPDPTGKLPVKLAQRPEQLRASVEDNLAGLGVAQLALVNLRRADGAHGLHIPDDQIVDFDDQMAAMIALRDEGKIGAIGLSAVSLDELRRAAPAGIACVQNAYSLVSRRFEDVLAFCQEQGIAWVPFFPLGGANPGLPKVVEQPAVIETAARLGVEPSQVGLAWLLDHAPNTLLIPGTSNLAHLEQNMAIGSITLDREAIAALDAIDVGAPGH